MPRPWFEERCGLLQTELDSLAEEGIEVELREEERRQGRIVLDLRYPVDKLHLDPPPVEDDYLRLTARFPDSYPYFRPEVETDHLQLERHQAPEGGNLCLIGRSTAEWSSEDTLAHLLEEQLAEVLRRGRVTDPNVLILDEGEQAEPVTDYYSYQPGSGFLIEPPAHLPDLTDVARGSLLLGFRDCSNIRRVRGAVIEIRDLTGTSIASLGNDIANTYENHFGARWVRLDEPLQPSDAFSELRHRVPEIFRPKHQLQPLGDGRAEIIGVVFPDEVEVPGGGSDGWLFVVHFLERGRERNNSRAYLAPAMRVDEQTRFARAPELQPLRKKVVGAVGLGCLGAPSVLELARAGVSELRIVDYDSVDPATTLRWPLGFAEAGKPKVDAIKKFVFEQYPYCHVDPYQHKIGAAVDAAEYTDGEVLEALLDGTDLLYDASAEYGVHHYLSQAAREAGVPYICVGGRQGGWGGVVLRDLPNTPGCWGCYHRHRASGMIAPPPSAPTTDVQPAGCADPTFTGASFDLQQIAMMGVRLAVATLCQEEGGYPDVPWNVATLSLRDGDGNPHEPRWETDPLVAHPDCEACQ